MNPKIEEAVKTKKKRKQIPERKKESNEMES